MSMDLEELGKLEEHYDKIYRYCYMKTQHQQNAEDITQETFLRFLEDHEYTEMGKRLAYLYTIARNLCIDYYRREGCRETVPLEEDTFQNGLYSRDSKENTLVMRHTLGQALDGLREEERELIFLRYVNEVPVGQISSILGISRFAVYRKEQAALKKLKAELGKGEFDA